MKTTKAHSLEQANELLSKGLAKNVELCFELTTDEFFRFTDHWCDKGAKILKKEHFVVKLKPSASVSDPE
ncbi:hypothetical protein C7434_0250 [Pantoea sp. PNA 14-12]|uniref:Uncharacterized protein n=1 Tax=Pantoea stewartii TaxID=66269 RepID=A0AB34VBC6_9GAMM|nr:MULTISPECIES: hypothetical protein [Pantoea]KKW49489.1 hypothetical protein XB02_17670 [Pantoea ananatis]KGD84542.1 hypothetical protein HA47_06975 [Pantoea stewartii subsp. indologenes]KHD99758.1 hypothetical protein NL54_19080 [Pantoea stewartii]KHN64828.1 hypothetical protein OI73_02585 [Pantoea stewartii]KTS30151.1 hypothetical protein NS381_01530 [Pantoea stewartii]